MKLQDFVYASASTVEPLQNETRLTLSYSMCPIAYVVTFAAGCAQKVALLVGPIVQRQRRWARRRDE